MFFDYSGVKPPTSAANKSLFPSSILLSGPAASQAAVSAAAATLISIQTARLLLTECVKTRLVNVFDCKVLSATTLLLLPHLSAGFSAPLNQQQTAFRQLEHLRAHSSASF